MAGADGNLRFFASPSRDGRGMLPAEGWRSVNQTLGFS